MIGSGGISVVSLVREDGINGWLDSAYQTHFRITNKTRRRIPYSQPMSYQNPVLCSRIGEKWQKASPRDDRRIKRIISLAVEMRSLERAGQKKKAASLAENLQRELGRYSKHERCVIAAGIGLAVSFDGKVLL